MHHLKAENVSKVFDSKSVVNGVTIDLSSKEVVGLLGPNGAGKTTTFYMLVGLVSPTNGRILLDSKDITKVPMYKRAHLGMGYLPQEPSIFRKLTVKENILAILETINFDSHKIMLSRLKELMDELGLTKLQNNIAASLSGGERRRLEIARALARSPYFILLDEPFAGIDPLAIKDIQLMIEKLRDKGIGILITDHNVRETLDICNRAYILVDGKVLESGVPSVISNSEVAKRYYLGSDFSLK